MFLLKIAHIFSLFSAGLIHSSLPVFCLKSILILFSHLRLGVPSGLFSAGFPIKILCEHLLSLLRIAWPASVLQLDLITTFSLSLLFSEYDRRVPAKCEPVSHKGDLKIILKWI